MCSLSQLLRARALSIIWKVEVAWPMGSHFVEWWGSLLRRWVRRTSPHFVACHFTLRQTIRLTLSTPNLDTIINWDVVNYIYFWYPFFNWFKILSVFVYICPPHCERNSAHIVRTFPSSFRCVFDIVAHNVAGKSKILQYVGVRSFSQFLIIFIVHSIQFFIVSSKISKFLKLDQNWRF